MADETPPLDETRLAEIRARAKVSWEMLEKTDTISVEVALTRDSLALLAEVDRLRAREAAAMEIMNHLIHMAREPFICAGCGANWTQAQNHKPDCPITRGYAWIDARTPQE